MDTTTTPSASPGASGLLLAREQISAARTRDAMPSDGGSSGRSDTND
ncbi:hypothetical protein ACGFIV_17775 [Sphaerisporangium sp. NPDC049003]